MDSTSLIAGKIGSVLGRALIPCLFAIYCLIFGCKTKGQLISVWVWGILGNFFANYHDGFSWASLGSIEKAGCIVTLIVCLIVTGRYFEKKGK